MIQIFCKDKKNIVISKPNS